MRKATAPGMKTEKAVGRWRAFVLPERDITLKLAFDNPRNYVLCGAISAIAAWSGHTASFAITTGIASAVDKMFLAAAIVLWGVTVVAMFCNGVQSAYLMASVVGTLLGLEEDVSGSSGATLFQIFRSAFSLAEGPREIGRVCLVGAATLLVVLGAAIVFAAIFVVMAYWATNGPSLQPR